MCNKITYILFSEYCVGPKQVDAHWLIDGWKKQMQQFFNGKKKNEETKPHPEIKMYPLNSAHK
jgi:hypothetical protein